MTSELFPIKPVAREFSALLKSSSTRSTASKDPIDDELILSQSDATMEQHHTELNQV